MIGRVKVSSTANGKQVVPVEGATPTGTWEYTLLNTHPTKTVELVASHEGAWGTGFPLVAGGSWSGQVGPTEKMYVIAQDTTTIDLAYIAVQTT